MAFELGINYWPRGAAMDMWRSLDLGAVREELAHVRDLGFTVVRFFLLARAFLPAPLRVDAGRIAALVEVARAARDAGLRSVPTLITINMSGRIWWPDWMDAHGPRDLFGDPLLLRSQALLVAEAARALSGDASVRAFDLANELDDAVRPRDRHAAWLWCALLAGEVRRAAPGVPLAVGLHQASLADENQVRVDDIAQVVDEDVMHAYPLYTHVARSPLDPELVPFCLALTADLAGTARAPLMQEFGLCTAGRGEPSRTIVDDFLGRPREQYLASEEEAAAYHEAVLLRLWEMGAAGAYPWCYGDYDPRLYDRPPLDRAVRERSFGLVRADGSEKPAAQVYRRLARRIAAGESPPPWTASAHILDVSPDDYYEQPAAHFARLYARWLKTRGN